MSEPTVGTTGSPIPTCITKCCREWISPPPGLYGAGECGICGESEWVTPSPPIRPEALR